MAKKHFTGATAPSQGPAPAISFTPAQPGTLADLGICIRITPRADVIYEGTAEQLTAEGLIPADFEFPHGRSLKSWQADGHDYSIHRWKPAGMTGALWRDSAKDHWVLREGLTATRGQGLRAAVIFEAEQQLEAAMRGSKFGCAEWCRAFEDKQFQALLQFVGARPAPKARKSRGAQA